jgi:hypothetical protein
MALCSAAVLSVSSSLASAQAMPPSMAGTYTVLTNRNIFLNGISARQLAPVPVPSKPEDLLVLVGATESVGPGAVNPMTAFILDSDSQHVSALSIGDSVAGGTVVAIRLNEIVFLSHGLTRDIEIGQNLAGAQIFGANASASTTMPAAPDFNGPHGDMLKLLWERRNKEQNGIR